MWKVVRRAEQNIASQLKVQRVINGNKPYKAVKPPHYILATVQLGISSKPRFYSASKSLHQQSVPPESTISTTTNVSSTATTDISANAADIAQSDVAQLLDISNMTLSQSDALLRLTDFAYYNYPWDPVIYSVQFLLDGIHISTGLPWWGSIIAFAFLARLSVTPLLIKQLRVSHIMRKIQPEIAEMRNRSLMKYKMDNAAGKKTSAGGVLESTMELNKILAKYGLSQFSMFKYAMPQAALLISCFVSMNLMSRDITMMNIQMGLKTQGFLWFRDLTSMDPFFLLPTLSMISTAGLLLVTPSTKRSKTTTAMIVIGISVITLFFTYKFPAAIHLFWITSNSLSIATTLMLNQKKFKEYFNIPDVEEKTYSKDTKLYDYNPLKKAKAKRS